MREIEIHNIFSNDIEPESVLNENMIIQPSSINKNTGIYNWPVAKFNSLKSNQNFQLGMYSSGTTKASKTLIFRHHNEIKNEILSLNKILFFLHHKRFLVCAPANHSFGLIPGLLVSRQLSSFVHYIPNYLEFLNGLDELQTQVLIATQAHIKILYERIKTKGKYPYLKWIIWAGSPLNVELVTRLKNMGLNLIQIYGTTETGAICVCLDVSRNNLSTFENILDHLKVKINAFKEIEVLLSNGQILNTKDKGDLCPNGNLTIHGRSDKIIFKNGNKIELDLIQEIAISESNGIPTKITYEKNIGGDIEIICSVKGNYLDAKNIYCALKNKLPAYALPKRIEVIE